MWAGRCLSRTIFCLSLLSASTLLHAQFQQPTDEELKMTSDPKYPGVAAVILYQEEIDNDPLHYQAFYSRIKVLTEKGKELATVDVPFLHGNMKVTDIKARTIHADGTIVPLVGKPEELLVGKKGDRQINRKVFNLPAVEVGSILEYRYEIRYDDNTYSSPDWDIQQPYPVRKAHYSFQPQINFQPGSHMGSSTGLIDEKGNVVNNLIWWIRAPHGETIKSDASGHYLLDVADVPPAPDEEYMPPIASTLNSVHFYYKSAYSAMDYWINAAKGWSKDTDRFAESNKYIKDEVAKLIAPTDSELDKAKKLYAAVQALDNTDYSRKKTESERRDLKLKDVKHADEVWKQKSGDSEEIAMLYLAMLRAAGLKAYAVKVVARNRGVFDPTYMHLGQLDDTLVQLDTGGKSYTLDPGEKMCPFGGVNWRHAGVRGLGQGDKGPGIAEMPRLSYKENGLTRTGTLTLDASGAIVSGQLQFVMTGQKALYWRQQALQNDSDELKKSFDKELEEQVPEGVEAHLDHFLALDNAEANLIAVIKVSGRMGTATAKRLLLPGQFFVARGHTPFVAQEKRLTPVDMHYASVVNDQVTYKLPEGFSVEGAPQERTLPWTAHAVYVAESAVTPGQVIVARRLAQAFDQAKPEEYQDLRGFYQKVAAADQQQLVLIKAPAAAAEKGN